MKVRNVHERILNAPSSRVGKLLDSLASPEDVLWPHQYWPAMKFDRPLEVGAIGGHGPIRYSIQAYEPGQLIRFRFTKPHGFNGSHSFEVEPLEEDNSRLRHILEMNTTGFASISWLLVYRSLHDALIEDSLDLAQSGLGTEAQTNEWSLWVKLLRWVLSGKRVRKSERQRVNFYG